MTEITSSWKDQTKRERIIEIINQLKIKNIKDIKSVKVPEGLKGFGTIKFIENNCIACAACARICPTNAIIIRDKYALESVIERWKNSKASNRKRLAELLNSLKQTNKIEEFNISPNIIGFGEIEILPEKCTFCLDCIDVCGFEALEPELQWDLQKILLRNE
ncbi:MAG: 4Fe-4S dicluster domain-containing protein [Candidatus Lokiarchaeota archaeon]|nr:4Fe-4S dicluster domain-containing protein [Candidatus Lokiarchaeota archaeon]